MEDLTPDVSLRPYFIPDELDFDELPAAVQVAVEALVAPAYQELVLQAPSALERAAGASFVHLLFLELLEQFELGQQISENIKAAGNRTSPREADLRRHLRLLSGKERAGTFLLRIRQFHATKGDPMVWRRVGTNVRHENSVTTEEDVTYRESSLFEEDAELEDLYDDEHQDPFEFEHGNASI